MDSLTAKERSERMSRVRSKDTGPELKVRSLVHRLGFRYRLHVARLPGHPDLVFSGKRKVIFVHGCFWHRHGGCSNNRLPKSRIDFWTQKLETNRRRDARNLRKLRRLGWSTLVVWECEVRGTQKLSRRVNSFLKGARR